MIRAYFDDSGDGKREQYSVCGDVFGADTAWDRAEAAWLALTKHLTLPFRSIDCECRHGQFEEWDKPNCDQLMADLVSVLFEHRLGAYAAIVPIQDFKDVFPDYGEYDPDYLAYATAIVNVAVSAEYNTALGKMLSREYDFPFVDSDLDVLFWFEGSEVTDSRCGVIYSELKSLQSWPERNRIAGVTLADKGCVPLQAADLMAREAFKFADNKGKRNVRKPALKLRNQITYHTWHRRDFERLRDLGGYQNMDAVMKIAIDFSRQLIAKPITPGPY